MSGSNGTPRGFNADERAAEREAGPITIGGTQYHPRRLTNAKLRAVRRTARQAGREAEKLAETTEDYREALDREIADGTSEEEAKKIAKDEAFGSDEVAEVNLGSLALQLHDLIVDGDMQPVPVERIRKHLDEDLDSRDIEGLMNYLLGTPDPTPSPTPSAS